MGKLEHQEFMKQIGHLNWMKSYYWILNQSIKQMTLSKTFASKPFENFDTLSLGSFD